MNGYSRSKRLKEFDFLKLFIEELGWSQPADCKPVAMRHGDAAFTRRQVAQLAGVVVFEVEAADDRIPEYMHTEKLPPHDAVFTVSDADLDSVYDFVPETAAAMGIEDRYQKPA